jgi:hypothetical protein
MSSRKTTRRCSLCRKTGHTKRTCSFDFKKDTIKKDTSFIRVQQEKKASPHIVNLRDTSVEKIWSGVKAFTEKKESKQTSVTVDFAAMVRDANKKKQQAISSKKIKVSPFKKERKKIFSPVLQNILGFVTQKLVFRKKVRRDAFTNNVFTSMRAVYQSLQWKRLAYASVALFLAIAVPFPAVGYYHKVQDISRHVVEVSTHGFLSLQSSTIAALGADIPQAEAGLSDALAAFSEANSILEEDHHVLQYVAGLLPIVGSQVEARKQVLVAGQHLAVGNTYLLKGLDAADDGEHITDQLDIVKVHIDRAIPQYEEALIALSSIDTKDIPANYQQSFVDFRLLFATFIDDMKDLVALVDTLELVFGSEDFRRYLIVFQNNREIRATGGFMGSFAVLDVQKGKIINIDIPAGGAYDVKGQLDVFVEPPTPLQVVNKRWEFHDSNWWPDFPSSAKKMQWFYEHSSGRTVDGVITINATVLEKFLAVVGPVENDEYDVVLTAETGLDTLQRQVEIEYDHEANTPKAIIGDMVEQFLSLGEHLDNGKIMQLLTVLHTSAESKDIQAYMNDDAVQSVFQDFGWAGKIFDTQKEQDYLMVVNTNLQGQKSDAKITQHVEHQAVVQEDGSIIDTVVVRRRHEGNPGELFYGGMNINYMRVYVPEGAILLDAGGFSYPAEEDFKIPESWYEKDVDLANHEQREQFHDETGTRIIESFGKTVFENWVATAPGEESQAYFVYKLPFGIKSEHEIQRQNKQSWSNRLIASDDVDVSKYSLVAQRQSGVESTFASAIIYPDGWSPVWRSNEAIDFAANGAQIEQVLERDTLFGVVMEKKIQ